MVLLLLWLLFGDGRNGSLTYCFPAVPWLQQIVGILLVGSVVVAVVMALFSFVDGSWRWAVASVLVIVCCSPVALLVVLLISFGDPGIEGVDYCLFMPD